MQPDASMVEAEAVKQSSLIAPVTTPVSKGASWVTNFDINCRIRGRMFAEARLEGKAFNIMIDQSGSA